MHAWKTWNKNLKSARTLFCSVPVCVRHPLVRRQALGTGRDPAARFSFLPSTGNSSLLPSQTDLGSPWSSPVWDRGALLPAIVAGGRRWKQVATYFFAFLHPLRRPTWGLRLAKQLLTLCRYKKGIKPLFMTKMNEKINIRSTWALRLAKQPLTDVTEWSKVQTKKQGTWITFKENKLANLCPGPIAIYSIISKGCYLCFWTNMN